MPSVPFFKFRFTPSWVMLALTMIFILTFVRLGFWQLQRADEKAQMVSAQKMRELRPPVFWNKQKVPEQYERIQLEGHYLSQIFLLDNQHYKHQFGYNVLSPLELPDGSVILIDRGWILGDISRRVVPKVEIPKDLIKLQGSVYFPSKNQWVLGPALEKKDDKTTVFEALDTHLASQVLQKSVYPFIIRLDKQDSHGFVREWETVSMPPQRHLAYALQWFAMAFVILIIFFALNLKKKNEETIH